MKRKVGLRTTPGRRARADKAALDAITPELERRAKGRCEAKVPNVCSGGMDHRHHRRRVRSDNRIENLLYVCWNCHKFIHEHPKWAYAHGLLVKYGSDPTIIPVGRFDLLASSRWPRTQSSSTSVESPPHKGL